MLGRYIAATLLCLGIAMLIAPVPAEKAAVGTASRSHFEPYSLDVEKPVALAVSLQARAHNQALLSGRETGEPLSPFETALAEVLALDVSGKTVAAEKNLAADSPKSAPPAPLTRVAARESAVLSVSAAPTRAEIAPPSREGAARYLFVTGSRVNVREGPSTHFPVVGRVEYGDPVELLAYEDEGWARIRLGEGGTMGFMSRQFLASATSGG